jgi:hypothetical protein
VLKKKSGLKKEADRERERKLHMMIIINNGNKREWNRGLGV